MKNITLQVYAFNDLSEEAKQNAYEEWRSGAANMSYGWSGENRDVLDFIAKETGINVRDWQYDTCSYHYSLDAAELERLTHPEAIYECNSDMDELYGIRAAKVALKIYYQLTEQRIVYGFEKGDKKKISITWLRYGSRFTKKRLSAFKAVEQCFTGYCASDTFSRTLWNSIAKNGHNDNYSFKDHLEAAFDKLFHEFSEDMAYSESYDYFADSEAHNYDYLADGSIFEIPTEALEVA